MTNAIIKLESLKDSICQTISVPIITSSSIPIINVSIPVLRHVCPCYIFIECVPAVGNIAKAAETAATFLRMEPSNSEMANNVKFYTTQFKLTAEQFQPREVCCVMEHNIA